MARLLALSAAGRFIIDNVPYAHPGRGSVANRSTTLGSFSVVKLIEHLFEGGTSTWLDEEIGTLDLLTNVEPLHNGALLTFASLDSVIFSKTTSEYAIAASGHNYGTSVYAWEMWMKPPGWIDSRANFNGMLVGVINSTHKFLGKYSQNATTCWNFPVCVNKFNTTIYWESKYNIPDNIVLQIVEAHESATRTNFIVVINGIPVASQADGTGMLEEWDNLGTGPAYNGRGATDAADRGAQEMASVTWYDNGQTLTLQDIRELYETSAILAKDMLTLPRWILGDSENTTLVDDGITDALATLGDVTDATGIRSGAIPRDREKIYFEMEIMSQGDAINAVRPGIRRMISEADVGDQTTVGDDGNEHHWYVDGDDIHVDRGTDTTIDVDTLTIGQATGVVIMVAINWTTGDFWIGRNGVWGDNSGDPGTDSNPIDQLDPTTNWAAHIFNNGALGNGVVKLRTKFHQMKYPVPTDFDSWERLVYTVESTVYGVNRRRAALEYTGTILGIQWLLEGGAPAYLADSSGRLKLRGILTDGAGDAAAHGGLQLSYASVDSVRWPRTVNAEARHLAEYDSTIHALELWFRQPDFGQDQCTLVGHSANSNIGIGNGLGTRNFPAFQNQIGDTLYWESEIDVYGDNLPHCIMELDDYGDDQEVLVVLDGMPVAKTSGIGGWFAIGSNGVKFNDDQNDGDSRRSGGDYGSWHEYRGGDTIDLFSARKIFEASALSGHDMLTAPQWCTLDSINSTIDGTGKKDCLNADVTDDTGCRSYAIPRTGKIYFEVEIIAQGDTTSSCLLGLRKLAEPSNVGFDPDVATDEYHTDGVGGVEDGQDNNLSITGTLGTAATGRIFQFAIDWATGDWWMGTDNTLWAGEGGTGNPSTGANPLTAIDFEHNWATILRVNGANGNGKCRLITHPTDFNYLPPTDFLPWEPELDPLFDNVVLLVRSVGATHAQITFADESNDTETLTRGGDAIYDNAQSLFGAAASMLFDGSGNDWVLVPDITNLEFADRTIEFCMEAWIYITDNSSANTILCGRDASSAEEFAFRTGGTVDPAPLVFNLYGSGATRATIASASVLNENTWYHVAVTRELVSGDGLITLYIDGVASGNVTQTIDGTTNTQGYHIGHNEFDNSRDFTGHIDSVRVTRGATRYSTGFTKPNTPFPNI